MVCGRCGNNNPQGGRYCENCGNDLWAVGTTKKQKGQQNQQNSKTKLIVLIVAVIVAIAAVVGSVILISQSGEKSGGSSSGDGIEKLDSYEEVFDNYAKAYETGDIKYILKAFPEQAQELFKKNEEYKEMMVKNFEEEIADVEEEFGEVSDVSYTINGKEKVDEDTLNEYREQLDEMLTQAKQEYGMSLSKVEISEGYVLDVVITVSGSKLEDTLYHDEFVVLKINGSWCMM